QRERAGLDTEISLFIKIQHVGLSGREVWIVPNRRYIHSCKTTDIIVNNAYMKESDLNDKFSKSLLDRIIFVRQGGLKPLADEVIRGRAPSRYANIGHSTSRKNC
ncbi:hypothetical protein JYG56_23945, partial [Escherichia fergusonii]|nr:hypothetical protein [Escherichia fergusonii]